jgi:aminoglycoside phosphotransferase (APT) family kinase protein
VSPSRSPLGAISLDDVRAWLAMRGVILAPPLRHRLVSGGRSNLTYLISAADGTQVVLRRPPLDLVLATAHDMNREWRFISALQDTSVPVPEPLAQDASGELLGVPFYVMSHVEGIVPHDAGRAAVLNLEARRTLAAQLIDVMVDLHSIDIDEVGLADIAKREGYILRQLRRWKRQWDQSACTDIRTVHEAYYRLEAAMPEQARTGIVHGDLRLGNVAMADDGFDFTHIRSSIEARAEQALELLSQV